MSKRLAARAVGVEQARQRLPELLARAHRGEATVITRHGRPYAVLVPLEDARLVRPRASLTDLRGSGKGLWGGIARHVRTLRREWA